MAWNAPKTNDPLLERAFRDLETELARLDTANRRRGSAVFTEKSITTAGIEIEHGLGYRPQHVEVTYKDADVNVWVTAMTSTTVTLDASGTATINVEIW